VRELNQAGHTIVLTTHYLEEAEALCGRIAMLKHGRVVALDTTRNLLCGVAGVRVRVRLSPNRLPASMLPMLVGEDGESRVLALEGVTQIESVLTKLRSEQIELLELEVLQADLEDVFVQMMHRH
jgi:ABC-2 type transport system ATP-binding protein